MLASGTVIGFMGNPIDFTFGPPEDRIRLILVFKEQPEKPGSPVQGEVIDESTLQLTLTNVGGKLGSGTVKPILAGSIKGKALYIHLRIYDLKDSDKTIHYTFFLGEEVPSG